MADLSDLGAHAAGQSTNISLSGPSVDIRRLIVPKSRSHNNRVKKDFCIYCKKLVRTFARHLQSKLHQNEDDVKVFMKCPEGSLERKRLINKIRKKGNFLHNTNPAYNTGILITCRQRQLRSKNSAEDYRVCNNCQGSFAKRAIYMHYKTCKTDQMERTREISVMDQEISGCCHPRASIFLQKVIIPGMHDDNITQSIKFDYLIIVTGNKLCDEYTVEKSVEMIRGYLRLLGRLKLVIQTKYKDIQELACIFHPRHYDTVVESVRQIARYNPLERCYGAPSNAIILAGLIEKCSRIMILECIKVQNDERKRAVENFMIIYKDDFPTTITKKVEEQIMRTRLRREISIIEDLTIADLLGITIRKEPAEISTTHAHDQSTDDVMALN